MTTQGAVSTGTETEKEKEPGAEKRITHCAGKELASHIRGYKDRQGIP
jgi:hypothetical protein